jgi:hypothetical protein
MSAKASNRTLCRGLLGPGLALLLIACSPAPEAPVPAAPDPSTAKVPAMTVQPELESAVAQARAALAIRLEVEPETIAVIEARYVTWRSGAMGCPEPDMMYTQALVPGYRILLRAGKEVHAYHGARGSAPFFCPADRATEPLPDSDDLR